MTSNHNRILIFLLYQSNDYGPQASNDIIMIESIYILLLSFMIKLLIMVFLNLSLSADTFSSNIFIITDKLMELNGFSKSLQISKCFLEQEKNQLKNFTKNLLDVAIGSSLVGFKIFPELLRKVFNSSFSQSTKNCLVNCNDVQILLKQFQLKAETVDQKFVAYATRKFQQVHYMFNNLNQQFVKQDYEGFAKTVNDAGHKIFGNLSVSEWTILVQNVQKLTEYFGVSVSNGILGATSSQYPLQVSETVIGGAYDKMGRGKVDNMVETFSAINCNLQCSYNGGYYYNFAQQLNMKQGKMSASLSSPECSVSYEYYALKNLPFVFYTQVSIIPTSDGDILIENKQQGPIYMNSIEKGYEWIGSSPILTTQGTTKTGKMNIAIASSVMIDSPNLSKTAIHEDRDSNYHLESILVKGKKGQIIQFRIITSIMTTQHHSDPLNQAIRMVIRGVSMAKQDVFNAHRKNWEDLWQNDIIISGNDQDQKNVRLMLYHFYAFLNEGISNGLSPMGLSGIGYNGHIFWDMDLWMYPAILALKPNLAKTMVQYRLNRLGAAKMNAFINGYKGSMFPWESSKTGEQQCPIWALSGPLEHHISGCVAYAVWNYYRVTQDIDWLRNEGYEVLSSVSQFWVSRVILEQDGFYHIKNVVAADEWADNVDDNAFTNAVAITSLQIANKANMILGYGQNKIWKQISEKIIILKMSNNVTKQHSTYNGQNIKQADVNLLAYPLNIITDRDQIIRDLTYYQTRIPNQGTPAMTYSIFTILYSQLGDSNKSYAFFQQSFQENLRKPFNVFAETKGGNNPYFLTGAGGVLQSMIFGFGGYEITDAGIIIKQHAKPKEWTNLVIKGFIKQTPKLDKYQQTS